MAGALDVAVKSDNFCLFFQYGNWIFCYTKSEWAAWVQAVGSLIAIAVAIYVPYKIHKDQIFIKREEDLKIAQALLASVFIRMNPLEEYSNMFKYWLLHKGVIGEEIITCEKNAELLMKISLPTFNEVVAIAAVNHEFADDINYATELVRAMIFKLQVYSINNRIFPDKSGVEHLSELNSYLESIVKKIKKRRK